jgi:hypothetical protein
MCQWLTTSLNGGRLHRPAVSGYDKRADQAEVLWLAATTETITDWRIKRSLRQKVSREWQAVVSIGGVCGGGVLETRLCTDIKLFKYLLDVMCRYMYRTCKLGLYQCLIFHCVGRIFYP